MTAADVTVQDYRLIAPDTVTPHPDNPRRGHLAAITDSIRANGFYGAIVVQASTQRVIAGNHRLLAARELGLAQIPATFVDVDDATALRILAVDNRANDLAGYDNDALLELLTTLDATEMRLEGTGYTDADLDQLLNPQGPPARTDPDDVPAAPTDPVTRAGDVWLLGPHRLLCGDARDPADVTRLLDGVQVNVAFTSPPYADRRKYDGTSQPVRPDAYVDWFEPIQANIRAVLAPDGSWLLNIKEHCEDGQRHLYVKDLTIAHVRRWGWLFVDELCWVDTRNGVPGGWPNRFKDAWEPVFHYSAGGQIKFNPQVNGEHSDNVFTYSPDNAKSGSGSGLLGGEKWNGMGEGIARPSNVLHIAAAASADLEHSAPFPVDLPAWFIRAYSDPGDVVFDPFMGSGSTLLAAHAEDRVGYGMEISPAYCDVILQRFTDHTGITPTNQDTGQAWAGKRHTSETAAI